MRIIKVCEKHRRMAIDYYLREQYGYVWPDAIKANFELRIVNQDKCWFCKRSGK